MARWQSCLLLLLIWAYHANALQAQTGLTTQLLLGVGATQRGLEVPSADGPRRLDFGPTPAVSLGIDNDVRFGRHLLGLGLRYRTSMLGRVRDVAAGPNADMSQTAVRSHQLEVGLRSGVLFGRDDGGVALRLFAGYSLRAFASVAALRVPRFTLHGPVFRLELDLPLPAASLRLRVAPELQWLPSISAALRDTGEIIGSAFGFGGSVAVLMPIGSRFGLQLEYRESHARARAYAARDFSDVERYLILGVAYAFL